ncbi:hypothetical protein Syun_009720 [Stephania yunnanensis]|uniref:Uncharacterized protein n=1 Tax=Stephania yunnanensis TaxID=152371 RepID=A0AAP0KF20_9MAGN
MAALSQCLPLLSAKTLARVSLSRTLRSSPCLVISLATLVRSDASDLILLNKLKMKYFHSSPIASCLSMNNNLATPRSPKSSSEGWPGGLKRKKYADISSSLETFLKLLSSLIRPLEDLK